MSFRHNVLPIIPAYFGNVTNSLESSLNCLNQERKKANSKAKIILSRRRWGYADSKTSQTQDSFKSQVPRKEKTHE